MTRTLLSPRFWLSLGLIVILVAVLPSVSAQAQTVTAGSLDLSFSGDGVVTTDFGNLDEHLRAVAVQPDGKIVAAGYTQGGHSFDFALVRYTAGGALDGSFGNGGKVTTEFGHHAHAHGMALQPDGKIVVVGHTHTLANDNFLIARYTANGSLDTSFGGDGKTALDFDGGFDYAFGAAVQPDGKILVAGTAFVDGAYDFGLARYNADGSLDTSFGTNGKVTTGFGPAGSNPNDTAQALALQSDGKIVLAGYSGTNFALARYNANGSLDTSFDTDGKVTTGFGKDNARIYKVAALSNGKIVAMGRSFAAINRDVDFEVARYNADGSLDASFGNGGTVRTDLGYGEYGYAGAVQPDGRIVVGGYLYDDALGDAPAAHQQLLIRYNVNGSRDTSFGQGGVVRKNIGGADQVYDVALQPDGKIVTAGNSSVDGNYDMAVARYHGRPQQTQVGGGGAGGGGAGGGGAGGGGAGGGGAGGGGAAGVAEDDSRGEATRLWGTDRYATSLAVAQQVAALNDGRLDTVVLAGGHSYADALIAGPLAGALDAALLLTPPSDGLPTDTIEWLEQLGVTTIIAVGDTQRITAETLAALTHIDGDIERITAADPYATAVAVARRIGQPRSLGPLLGRTVIVASGKAFADALSAGPLAAHGPHPILYADEGTLHPEAAAYLAEHADHVIIMGGTAAVTDDIETQIRAIPQANRTGQRPMAITRLGGADRYATAVAFARWLNTPVLEGRHCFTPDTVGLATGINPADAAASAPLLARRCAPLLLTQPDRLPPIAASYLRRTSELIVFGGTAAINRTALRDWDQ